MAARTPISRPAGHDPAAPVTRGERMADRVAAFGGSWTFIAIFASVMVVWVGLNSVVLLHRGGAFDPYPYILLNLFLSMLAAIQAPIILMSQNRHSAKDRLTAQYDYEVNLKSELEILALHEKMDTLREQQWAELIRLQEDQLALLTRMVGSVKAIPHGAAPADAAAPGRPVIGLVP